MKFLPHTRRRFLTRASQAAIAGGLAHTNLRAGDSLPVGTAEHCIMLWLGGGMCHMDTFDPKRLGDPVTKKAGSAYPAIDTAVPGVQVCEHLPKCARMLDRMTVLRTVFHNVIDEHAAAVNRMHTGRAVSGTAQYPSIGSVVSHERGAAKDGVPPYVVIGYPNLAREPGFLGSRCGYLYLTDTESGPAGLTRPADISDSRQARRERLLNTLRGQMGEKDRRVAEYDGAITEGLRLSGPKFMRVFDLDEERGSLREAYGSEFGQRCLLARRLIESGSRFIEVSHNLNFINGTG